jgi:acyl phosphate:glycerol-3-phosphate acyltransferase
MLTGKEFTWVVSSYFLGCFTSAYYWVRWRTGLDLRHHGSGTLGARNAGRVLGAGGFTVTFLLDFAKGALAVGGAQYLHLGGIAVVASMLAVVMGHTWPVQLRFQGGKGISASLGAMVAYDPFIAAVLVGIFLPAFALLRSFTLGGLLAFALAPMAVFLWGLGNEATAAVSFLAILVLLAHRRNIREEFARFFPRRALKDGSVHDHKDPES